MLTEMNSKIFLENLLKSIDELKTLKSIDGNIYEFRIIPIIENGKNLNALDDFMRLNVLNHKFTTNKIYSLEDVVTILAYHSPLVPIWINIKYSGFNNGILLIEMECSLRFRKPSLLRNQDTGHAPFKVIN